MVENPDEDTEPHVQRLFIGSYRETGMWLQGLASVGFCVPALATYWGSYFFMNEKQGPQQNKGENYGRIALLALVVVALKTTIQIPLSAIWELASDIAAILFIIFGLMWLKEKMSSKKVSS